jgi:hypothetical protein
MIVCKEFPDREFNSQEELFKALKENKPSLVALKKSTEKRADAVSYVNSETSNLIANKEENGTNTEIDKLQVKVVINTTNFIDSHNDLHINGIWNKSVSDNANKGFLHLQEHDRDFDKVISDNAKGYVESISWKSLGLPYNGKTEALIFDSVIEKKRNEFMFKQYANGWVKNHSVGMRYVKIDLAINSESEWDKDEKELWDKYYSVVANKEVADERGYFWVVSEAKIIEGSAVVMGSNSATPTLSVENKEEAVIDTSEIKEEPTQVTQSEQETPKRKRSVII